MIRQRSNHVRNSNMRNIVLSIILVLSFLFYSVRMTQLQVIDAGRYVAQASHVTSLTSKIKAARGEILDYYGRPIAINREGYNIVFNKAYVNKDTINDTIYTIMKLLASNALTWRDDLPLGVSAPYAFTDTASRQTALKSMLKLANYATAKNCFDQMIKRYSLEGKDPAVQRKIMGVRYTMEQADFSVSTPYTFAEDISPEIMTFVSESHNELPGVTIEMASFREYADNTLAPHIIGRVGPIYAEDWEQLKKKGYSYNDKVGISGIEKAEENYLRGTDGEKTYTIDAQGKILESKVTKEPVSGNTVRLTLDKTVQVAAQNSLKSAIQQMNHDNLPVTAGAAVAINIKTGGVIASANYPTYTQDEYTKDYSKLASDKSKPLFDRAFNGAYPPGSAFKPVVACAALQTGKVGFDETIRCTHKYTYFDDYQPFCMGTHGNIGMVRALSKSCNFFFFEAGRRVGITTMNQYATGFGLGQSTGVEVQESKGVLAGPSNRDKWYEGYTIQAAIGQFDNAFTPLQMAAFTSNIANSGVRYKTTLIDRVVDYTQDKVVMQNKPVVLNTVKLDKKVIDTVKEGLLSVTEDGTGKTVFKNYPIKVGGKTGTAQVTGQVDHTVFIAFAPFDDPEIAVACVIEHGRYSRYSGSVIKSIFDSYFFTQLSGYKHEASYQVLP